MSEWWTYSLSDFLLFSPRTYYRLFELYNLAVWPAQFFALVLGLAILALAFRRPAWHGRAVAAILAACWLWVAWAYLFARYDTINWAARYFAAGFALQALLLAWTGVVRDRLVMRPGQTIAGRIGLGLFALRADRPAADRAAARRAALDAGWRFSASSPIRPWSRRSASSSPQSGRAGRFSPFRSPGARSAAPPCGPCTRPTRW